MKEVKMDSNINCVRCGQEFVCKPEDIINCDCSKVQLSIEEYQYINAQFAQCACNACLGDLKTEYKNKQLTSANSILRMLLFIVLSLFGKTELMHAQSYAPAVGHLGTSAIFKDSSVFVSWAVACESTRGFQDISDQSLGLTSIGDNSMATGKAQSNGVISLGDGGTAICTFANPIQNGPGFDFAVFENGFDDVFLELAFVEVSSDGINYFRFPAHSLTDTSTQTDSFGSTDATKINNLAGKYRGGYGTPFDLEDLSTAAGLNINHITHIKIIDVVGSLIRAYASRDAHGNKINDPWPTPFPSGGFDLDAIGVIHENTVVGISENSIESHIYLSPNPSSSAGQININSAIDLTLTEVFSAQGNLIMTTNSNKFSLTNCSPGFYFVRLHTSSGICTKRLLIL